MNWTRLMDAWDQHGPLVKAFGVLLGTAAAGVVAVAAGSFGAGVRLGEIQTRVDTLEATKAPRDDVEILKGDTTHIRRTVDELAPLVRQTATDVAVLKSEAAAERTKTEDHEQRLRAMEREP